MDFRMIILIAGALVFGTGLFRFIKAKGNIKELRLYGGIAYIGFAAMLITGMLVLEPLLSGTNSTIASIALLFVFFGAGKVLLEPGFKRK